MSTIYYLCKQLVPVCISQVSNWLIGTLSPSHITLCFGCKLQFSLVSSPPSTLGEKRGSGDIYVQQIAKVLQQAKLTLEKPQTTINLPCMNLIIPPPPPAPASCF